MHSVTGLAVASAFLGFLAVLTGNLWLAGVSAALAGSAGIISWRSVRIPKAAGTADPHLSAQLITVQEEERKRLSRELHDSVGQIITAVKMELARVNGQEEADALRLNRARAHADEALQTIRNVSRMLRPTLLDDLGLQATLEWHTAEFARRTGLQCRLNYGLSGSAELPESMNTCIYRVIQEALNNCEKHANASEVVVTVLQNHREIQVRISDNGRGLASDQVRTDRLGILGMRERAHMLEGNLQLESNDGHGTSVTLTLPAPNNL